MAERAIPKSFLMRRLHSLTGFWFTLFLIEHLVTNSQAALWITDDGTGFVHAVNAIHNLPYLPLIEITLLAVPILIHMIWGIEYARQAAPNSFPTDGRRPALAEYSRNKAYTWQRITSWILLFLVIFHVVHMRFYKYPISAKVGSETFYMVPIGMDPGIKTVAERLNVQLFDGEKIKTQKELIAQIPKLPGGQEELLLQKKEQEEEFLQALEDRPISKDEAIAVAPDFGTASLMIVRETFKWPLMIAIYTVFVLSAVYHGFNGLWTFLITWGISLTERAQRGLRVLCYALMLIVGFFGLSAIWLTYWVTLRT
jgi:succinate dehydrogenase / fumarate reductase cytochrome b subunit